MRGRKRAPHFVFFEVASIFERACESATAARRSKTVATKEIQLLHPLPDFGSQAPDLWPPTLHQESPRRIAERGRRGLPGSPSSFVPNGFPFCPIGSANTCPCGTKVPSQGLGCIDLTDSCAMPYRQPRFPTKGDFCPSRESWGHKGQNSGGCPAQAKELRQASCPPRWREVCPAWWGCGGCAVGSVGLRLGAGTQQLDTPTGQAYREILDFS